MNRALCFGCAMCLPVALLMSAGCHKKAETPKRPPTAVQAVKSSQASVPVIASTFGRLRASYDVDITPQVSGKIVAAPFTEGAPVEKGAVLFRIEPDTYQAALDQAVAQVASAEATLTQNRATLERNRKLLAQSLIAQEDFDKLATDVDVSAALLEQYRAAHVKAQVDFNYCTITAPVAGRVGKRLIDPGNVVAASSSQVLVNLRAMDPLYLDFTLSESQLPAVRKAMEAGTVEVLVAAESATGIPGLHQGKLQLLDNAVDTKSGTIALRASVSNPQLKLWPGQFVYAFPVLYILADAVIVPQSAVADGKNGPYAFVVQDNKAVLRMVERGPMVGEAIVVNQGVQAGELVVTDGQLGLWPGAPVQIKAEPDDAAKTLIRKRMANPNTLALMQVLASTGETPDQIALIVGLPEEQVKTAIDGVGAKQ